MRDLSLDECEELCGALSWIEVQDFFGDLLRSAEEGAQWTWNELKGILGADGDLQDECLALGGDYQSVSFEAGPQGITVTGASCSTSK